MDAIEQSHAAGAGKSSGLDDDDDEVEWMDTEPASSDQHPESDMTNLAASKQQALLPPVPHNTFNAPTATSGPMRSASGHAPKPPLAPAGNKRRQASLPKAPNGHAQSSRLPPAAEFDFSFMQSSKAAAPAPGAKPQANGSEADLPAASVRASASAARHSQAAERDALSDQQPKSPAGQQPIDAEALANTSPFKRAQPEDAESPFPSDALAEPSHQHAGSAHEGDDIMLEASPERDAAGPADGALQQPDDSASPFKSPQAQKQGPLEAPKANSPIPAATKALAEHRHPRSKPGKQSKSESAVNHLQAIIADTETPMTDALQDSVLLDTLKGVPDNAPMPFSIEDRGTGVTGDALMQANSSVTSSTAAAERHARHAAPGSVAELVADLPAPEAKGTDSAQAAAASSHADSGTGGRTAKQPQQVPAEQTGAEPGPEPSVGTTPQTQRDQQPQPSSTATAESGRAAQAGASTGINRSTGLPGYASGSLEPDLNHSAAGEEEDRGSRLLGHASGGLDPGPSGGVSGSLASFDLDAEMDSLEKQGKVSSTLPLKIQQAVKPWLNCVLLTFPYFQLALNAAEFSLPCMLCRCKRRCVHFCTGNSFISLLCTEAEVSPQIHPAVLCIGNARSCCKC